MTQVRNGSMNLMIFISICTGDGYSYPSETGANNQDADVSS